MIKNLIKPVLLVCLLLGYSAGLNAQLTSTTLVSNKDSYITTQAVNVNYGTSSTLKSGTSFYTGGRGGDVQYHHRTYVGFDLSSIPSNAIIQSAEVQMQTSGSVYSNTSWILRLVETSWTETGIKASLQPEISMDVNYDASSTSGTTNPTFSVTNMVQKMVYGALPNNGWVIQVEDEIINTFTGGSFHSREASSSDHRPKLVVNYYLPLELDNVVINHETSSSAGDASISFSLANGASTSYTYQWEDANGILSGQQSSTINNLNYGWYGVHVTGEQYGEELYYGFLVGINCQEVTINYQTTPEYTDNALLNDREPTSVVYRDVNYAGHKYIRAERWTASGIPYSQNDITKYKLWMDDAFTVNQADLSLTCAPNGQAQWVSNFGTNQAWFRLITTDWNESLVTANTPPSYSSSVQDEVPPATVTVAYSTENQTVDMSNLWNAWKADNSKNYGAYFILNDQTGSGYRKKNFYSPYWTTVSERPTIQFKLDLQKQPVVTTTWDNDTELGEINVDISEVCSKTAPYYYFISRDTIVDLDTIITVFEDTLIGGGMDSTQMLRLTQTGLQHSFTNLVPSEYYVSVYDINKNLLGAKKVEVQGSLEFENQVGLSISGSTITASQSNSVGVLELYTHENHTSSAFVEIEGTSGVQFFGYTVAGVSASTYSDVKYGFYLNGTTLKTIDNGVLSASSITVASGAKLQIINEQGSLKLMVNGVQQASKTMSTDFEYQVGMKMQPGNLMRFKYEEMIGFKSKFRFESNQTSFFTCEGGEGAFRFSIRKRLSNDICPVSYTITDPNGHLVTSGNSNTLTEILISQYSSGGALEPGVYTVSGTINCSGETPIPFSGEVFLGYEVYWADETDYDYNTSILTLSRDAVTLPYAEARSGNVMKFNEEGIIDFSVNSLQHGSMNYLRFTTDNLYTQPTNLAIFSEDWVAVRRYQNEHTLLIHSTASATMSSYPISANSRIRLKFSVSGGVNHEVEVYVNDVLKQTIARGNSSNVIRCNTLKVDDGFEKVISSFGCPSTEQEIYAHLDYEMDGYYHVMKKGLIRFIFDQEYETEYLEFNIYNYHNTLVKTQADFPPVIATNGDNYITLDVSEDNSCVGRGFFHLEVINNKKEKLYLRFFNDFTHPDCIDYTADPGGNSNQ